MTSGITPDAIEKFDIAIIGGGSGGLVMAAVSANLGYKVALCEGHKMGGDCLNYGCVPSKALLAAAKVAHKARTAEKFGVLANDVQVDFEKVHAHVKGVIKQIEPHDSVERFESMGVTVIKEYAHFIDEEHIQAGERVITAKRFVVATGSTAFIPPIEGLQNTPYLTNESIFNLKKRPEHLVIVGGGPIGCEMAQAFSRLGSKVTIIEAAPRLLIKDDPEMAQVVVDTFTQENIDMLTHTQVQEVSQTIDGIRVTVKREDGHEEIFESSHILIAVGRKPNVDKIGLDEAGIKYNSKGIIVNKQLRTSNKNVFAVGDVAGPYQFTHMAGYQAGFVIGRSLFGNIFTKPNYNAVPWVTYTDPELAHVGMTLEQAVAHYGPATRSTIFEFKDNDRAVAERQTAGKIKVVTGPKGIVVGATIVGLNAGELIHEWAIMVTHKKHIKDMTSVIHAYPTLAEINKRVAGEYYKNVFYSARTGFISRLLFKWLG